MAILADTDCESLTGWTQTSNTSILTTNITSRVGNYYAGAAAIGMRFANMSWASTSQYAGVKQNITLPADYEVTFQLIASGQDYPSTIRPDDNNINFKVLWKGAVVFDINPNTSGSWSKISSVAEIYDDCDNEWDANEDSFRKSFTVDLSAYVGETGDLEFRIQGNLTDTGGSHCDWYFLNLDTISEVYNEITNYYVRASGGNDGNSGASWANAWATIDKAATTVADGTIVHIGFGTYSSEPTPNDIAPVNAGSVGIKYLPETAVTGGGTGSVTIEIN